MICSSVPILIFQLRDETHTVRYTISDAPQKKRAPDLLPKMMRTLVALGATLAISHAVPINNVREQSSLLGEPLQRNAAYTSSLVVPCDRRGV